MTNRSHASTPTVLARLVSLAGWLVLCFAAAGIGAAASVSADTFYAEITRPDWSPPAWLFGPVWTLLYAMMAVAAWLVWVARGSRPVRPALSLFLAQLALNALWSWLFFHWRLGGLALLDIVALWMLIVATAAAFWRVRPLAGALLVPYLLWVAFAAALNLAIWRLNPGLL